MKIFQFLAIYSFFLLLFIPFSPLGAETSDCSQFFSPLELKPNWTAKEVLDIIQSEPLSGIKVEIGAATNPLCENCIQVDLYRSSFDMNKQKAMFYLKSYEQGEHLPRGVLLETGGWLTDQERLERLSRLTLESPEKLLKPFAVNGPQGVIAYANRLPFADQSVSLLVKKNFPWTGPEAHFFGYSGAKDYYRSFLHEYRRVVTNNGMVVLLFGGDKNPRRVMAFHAREARRLGFKVLFVRGPEFSGILLGVDSDFNPSQRSLYRRVFERVEKLIERIN